MTPLKGYKTSMYIQTVLEVKKNNQNQELFYISLPLSQIFEPTPQLMTPTATEL